MFRAKINPQTVVTIQSAIPKAVVALILVTFSYAIAGLMIDLMYLLIGLIFGVIPANFKATLPHSGEVSYYYGGGFGELIHNVWDAGWESFWRVLTEGVGWTGLGIDAGITGIAAGIAALLSGPTGWVALYCRSYPYTINIPRRYNHSFLPPSKFLGAFSFLYQHHH